MLVSCVLPTRGRVEWARQAVQCVLDQTYAEKELVIFDDGDEPSFPRSISGMMVQYNHVTSEFHNTITVQGMTVRYLRSNATVRHPVWEKRNRVCEIAQGEVIAHYDSDDWSAPERLSRQIDLMAKTQKAVVGFNAMLFYEPATSRVATYIGKPEYALGTSLVYRKDFWESHRFERPTRGETGSDNAFGRTAVAANELATCDAEDLMVARVHDGRMNAGQSLEKIGREISMVRLPERFIAAW